MKGLSNVNRILTGLVGAVSEAWAQLRIGRLRVLLASSNGSFAVADFENQAVAAVRPGQRGREGVERCFVGQVGRHKSAARVGAVFHAGFVQPVIHGRAQGSLDGSQIDAAIDLNDGRVEKKLLRAGREQAGVIRRDPSARRKQGSADGIPPKAFVGIADGSPAAAALKLPCGAGHQLRDRKSVV